MLNNKVTNIANLLLL